MSTSTIVHLEDYRGRRDQRLQRTLALYRADAEKFKLIAHLRAAVALLGADRGAVAWVDEYGPGLVHVHCLLDLASDKPRRAFTVEPLREAWERGVPGLMDYPDLDRSGLASLFSDGPRSAVAVALGSDGARAWFIIVDSRSPRPPLSPEFGGELMFLAGECASLLLHRDAGRRSAAAASGSGEATETRFAGWPILQDIEGEEENEDVNRRIASRFLVTRVVRGLVDDDFAADDEALRHQVEGVRREIAGTLDDREDEGRAWDRVLSAAVLQDRAALAAATLELANCVERMDHLKGAVELYRTAYEIATVDGSVDVAVEAARFLGRVHRRLADWDDAVRWYGNARKVAQSMGDLGKEAVVLDGLAITFRDRGSLPRARETLHQALELADRGEDRYAQGSVHHDLMVVEKMLGNLSVAVEHGWTSVRRHLQESHRLYALTDLAAVFVEVGELDAAENAYAIVARLVDRYVYRIYALDALAYVSALRGDLDEFERRLEVVDAQEWEDAAPAIRAELLLYRGYGYRALGELRTAARWLERARSVADRHGINKVYFDADKALDGLASHMEEREELPTAPATASMAGIREELSVMREELVGAL